VGLFYLFIPLDSFEGPSGSNRGHLSWESRTALDAVVTRALDIADDHDAHLPFPRSPARRTMNTYLIRGMSVKVQMMRLSTPTKSSLEGPAGLCVKT